MANADQTVLTVQPSISKNRKYHRQFVPPQRTSGWFVTARLRRTVRKQMVLPRGEGSFNIPEYCGQLSSIIFCKHETKKTLFEPIDGQNLRLTTSLARFHQQFIFSVSTDLSNSEPGPEIPRAGRVGAPGGAAVRGRAILGANRTIRPRNKSPPYPHRHREKHRANVFPEAKTSEILCKPTKEQNQRLTRG